MLRRLVDGIRRLGAAKHERRERMLFPESLTTVSFDDAGIHGASPGSEPWSIPWADLERVEIHTTDEGPWATDVFWVLHTASARYPMPQGATGEHELFERLQALPGFDNEAVIAAMGSVENQRWVCWQRGG